MSKHRALVVEDDALILLGLEMILEDAGMEIVGTASTLAEAMQLAGSVEADVAILDVNLQDTLVFPAADLLLERHIPMIFTTGDTLGAKMPARFSAIQKVEKPYEPEALLRAVAAGMACDKLTQAIPSAK